MKKLFIGSFAFKSNIPLTGGLLLLLVLLLATKGLAQEESAGSSLPEVKYHLTARPWKAFNVSKEAYLDQVEGIVREVETYQNSRGAIIDPVTGYEEQYSTPYFAYAVGVLLSAGRAPDLVRQGLAAMNRATADVAGGASSIPDNHGEFFLAPLASAIPLYAPHVSATQLQIWKKRMANPIANVLRGTPYNWRTYAMKGEWYRVKNGYVDKEGSVRWIEKSWVETQRSRLRNNSWNFYHDKTSDPDTWPYESAARGNLLAMIADGYDGASRDEILSLLKRGTESSLLLQDPSGQGVAGGRTGNHTWNDIVLANGFETMAEVAFKEGDTRLAGQYRRAAALGFQSAQRWRRADGTYSVTKNHFNPADKTRYAGWSYVTNYNGYMMYHMAENYQRQASSIPEQPAPNEIGGYTMLTDRSFATAAANAGGMQMQVNLRGSTALVSNLYWTTLGVVRFGRAGWDSRLGPSDGVRETGSRSGVSFAPTFFENGQWVRLASVPERYEAFFSTQFTHPLLVRCRIEYKPKSGKTGPTFTNDFVITPDGILSTLRSTAPAFGITWPVLTYDGATNLSTSITSHVASTSFPGKTDEQNFISLHDSPTITATEATNRSSYGDLQPVRMVSNTSSNVTFIYPRSSEDPTAASVGISFRPSADGFSTLVGSVAGNTYVGRTSAGGEGASIDLNKDGVADATFSVSCGFMLQLENGVITKVETDRAVTATIQGQTYQLLAYMPVSVTAPDSPQMIHGFTSMISTQDGGLLLGGHAKPGKGAGQRPGSRGGYDMWLVKTDTAGNRLWDKTYGGSADDFLNRIIRTKDGGYLLGGSSKSGQSGDKTENSRGSQDFWVVKITATGEKEWDRRFGGSGFDDLRKLEQLASGDIILAGVSDSPAGGDKSQSSRGGLDYWVIKINSTGEKLWDKRYGGSGRDFLGSFTQTSGGGLLLGGTSASGMDGDKTEAGRGGNDFWVVRLDGSGNQLWDKRYGGSLDEELNSLGRIGTSEFFLTGHSASGVGADKSQGSQGGKDFWMVKIGGNGDKIWDRRYGGSSHDELWASMRTRDGGILLGGKSFSGSGGEKSQGSRGSSDYWLVKVNHQGDKQWDRRFGGSEAEELRFLSQLSDRSYLIGGRSQSGISGDRTQDSQGNPDYWLVKTDELGIQLWDKGYGVPSEQAASTESQPALILNENENDGQITLGAWPNPTTDKVAVSFRIPQSQQVSLRVYNSLGAEVAVLHEGEAQAGKSYEIEWKPGDRQSAGMYFLHLRTAGHLRHQKIILRK